MKDLFSILWSWFRGDIQIIGEILVDVTQLSPAAQADLQAILNAGSALTTAQAATNQANQTVANDQAQLQADQTTAASAATAQSQANDALKSAKAALVAQLDIDFPTT
jgi:hypothetical protein